MLNDLTCIRDDVGEIDRRLQQFLDIAISQSVFFNMYLLNSLILVRKIFLFYIL